LTIYIVHEYTGDNVYCMGVYFSEESARSSAAALYSANGPSVKYSVEEYEVLD
jgi:hypothetical protein